MLMTESPLKFEVLKNVTGRSQLGTLSHAIVACITESFGHEMPEDEVDDALKGELIVVAKTSEDQVIGFATLERHSVEDFQRGQLEGYTPETLRFSLGAGTVDQHYQGQGVYRELNRQRLGYAVENKAPLISTTTQNPRVENGVSRVLDEFVQSGKLKGYRVERVLLPEFYGRRLTKYSLDTKETPFASLDIDAGDAFSLVFHLEYIHSANKEMAVLNLV